MHAQRDIVVANLSVTLLYSIETNAHIIELFPPSGRGMTIVFFSATSITKFKGELMVMVSLSGL